MTQNKPLHIDTNGYLNVTAKDFVGRTIGILGTSGYGKSNTTAVIAEELLTAGVPICIIDVEGEYYGLKEEHDIYVVGNTINEDSTLDARLGPSSAADLAQRSYTKAQSIVIDVSGFTTGKEVSPEGEPCPDDRSAFLTAFFSRLWQVAMEHQYPYVIFLDEAETYIPQKGSTNISGILGVIAKRGRKRGLSLIAISQRTASVSKSVLSQCSMLFLHKVEWPNDVKVYCELIPLPARQTKQIIEKKKPGQIYFRFDGTGKSAQVRLRNTPEGGGTPSLDALPAQRGFDLGEIQPSLDMNVWQGAFDASL